MERPSAIFEACYAITGSAERMFPGCDSSLLRSGFQRFKGDRASPKGYSKRQSCNLTSSRRGNVGNGQGLGEQSKTSLGHKRTETTGVRELCCIERRAERRTGSAAGPSRACPFAGSKRRIEAGLHSACHDDTLGCVLDLNWCEFLSDADLPISPPP